MLESARAGYAAAGGQLWLHSDKTLLDQAVAVQIGYADKYDESGHPLDPLRVAMYPREADYVAYMIGAQIAMEERGASHWRRVLHPEGSKSGPCAACIADAQVRHPVEEPFFDHPNGVCDIEYVMFSVGSEEVSVPAPGREEPQDFIKHVKDLWAKTVSTIRRIRKGA